MRQRADALAAGGTGFLLGDGALSYGPESFVEGYYRTQLGPYFELGPDVQYVRYPGYNRARGPAWVSSSEPRFGIDAVAMVNAPSESVRSRR